jgi:lysine decarboxylase
VHKTGLGHTQASLACARTDRLEHSRLERAFDATHTTSPAGAILASIEGSLALMEVRGEELLDRALDVVRWARQQLAEALGPVGLPDEQLFPGPDGPLFDPLRLVVQLAPLGVDGLAVEEQMLRQGVAVEYADRDLLAPVVTVADDRGTVERLVREIVTAVRTTGAGRPRPVRAAISWRVAPEVAISPREAFFAGHERVPWERASGRVSAELVAPYPPGIPVLAPGEVITARHLRALRTAALEGARIAYAADPTLSSLEVVST